MQVARAGDPPLSFPKVSKKYQPLSHVPSADAQFRPNPIYPNTIKPTFVWKTNASVAIYNFLNNNQFYWECFYVEVQPQSQKLQQTTKKQTYLEKNVPYYIRGVMGEGVRLRNEILIENQTNEPPLQPQHPQQTIRTEQLLKGTSTNNNDNTNNIEYTVMDTSRQIVLYYLFETDIETQDWRENLQLWKGKTHIKEVDY